MLNHSREKQRAFLWTVASHLHKSLKQIIFFLLPLIYDLACGRRHQKCQGSGANNQHLLLALPHFLTRRTAELNEEGLPLLGFVQQACQALLFQPLNLCQTANVLMLIQVSGSAGRCQREWEAVNKEITYIHRVIAAVCQVAFERMSGWKSGGGKVAANGIREELSSSTHSQ